MKKWLKYSLIFILLFFVGVNILIAIHSYSLTHFKDDAPPLEQKNLDLPFSEKIKIAFTGIDIPRPKNDILPKKEFDEIFIAKTETESLSAWLIPSDSITSKGIVLIFHGYMDSKSRMLDRSSILNRLGYNTLLIDFTGSGDSSGNQSTIGFLEAKDVWTSYKYVKDSLPEENIYLLGFSMGSVAILKAQHDYPILAKGFILEAPYATFEGAIASRAKLLNFPTQPVSFLFTFWMGAVNGYNAFNMKPIVYAKTCATPTLVFCGAKDQYISNNEVQSIYDAIPTSQKRLILFEESIHESYLKKDSTLWMQNIKLFLEN